jgi:hypothetical protein
MSKMNRDIDNHCTVSRRQQDNLSEETLDVMGVSGSLSWCHWLNAWSAVVRHVLGVHRQIRRCRVRLSKILNIPQIIAEKWIKLDVRAKARPIVSINELVVGAVNDVDIPAHQAHLQTQDSRVAALLRENEFDGVTVHNPNKTLRKDVMSDFVDTVVACETLAKMGVQLNFVSAAFPSTKANGVEDSLEILSHESEAFFILTVL